MYDQKVVRELFEKWGHDEVQGDPGETTSRWTVPHINHVILDQYLPNEGTALDAGCGLGIEIVRMARRGLNVTALDISASLLRHAKGRVEKADLLDQVTFVQADITEPLPLPADSFDVCVAMTGVVSHTGSRHRNAISNLVACVKPNGLIILGVDSYYGKIREYLDTGRIDEAEHVADTRYTHTVSDTFEDYCFTAGELAGILNNLGCPTISILTVPSVGPYGFDIDAPVDVQQRRLALEHRFLAVPELLGAGDQMVGVFRKAV